MHLNAVIKGFLAEPELRECQEQARRYLSDVAPQKSDGEVFYLDRQQPDSIVQAHEMYEEAYFRELPWCPAWLEVSTVPALLIRCAPLFMSACFAKGIEKGRREINGAGDALGRTLLRRDHGVPPEEHFQPRRGRPAVLQVDGAAQQRPWRPLRPLATAPR